MANKKNNLKLSDRLVARSGFPLRSSFTDVNKEFAVSLGIPFIKNNEKNSDIAYTQPDDFDTNFENDHIDFSVLLDKLDTLDKIA